MQDRAAGRGKQATDSGGDGRVGGQGELRKWNFGEILLIFKLWVDYFGKDLDLIHK